MLKGAGDPQYTKKHVVTNCVGPCLLYNLLVPIMTKTAAISPTATVRTAWAALVGIHIAAPKPGGMLIDDYGEPQHHDDEFVDYSQTKTGNVFLARMYAADTPANGIVHVAFNPGNLNSELQRTWRNLMSYIMVSSSSRAASYVI
jgi:retinol dehydrogenase 12